MNRLRGKKKVVEESESSTSTSFFKKGKKAPAEKVELDLKTALPSADDFRTSLLMNNLSARFSMLREQDDPSSLLGKANDDSVLFPRRASRLNLFAHNPLTDIDEVASIKSSIRPPFANERQNSFGSEGFGSDDDAAGVMNRGRPCDGNVLFGGRQKVYKIPVGSTSQRTISSAGDDESKNTASMGGRAVYDQDLSLSTFQKLRREERERERLAAEDLETSQNDMQDTEETSQDDFRRNRATSSSTTSGPSINRVSTAATSIDSQGPNQIGPSHSNRSSAANSPVVSTKPMHSGTPYNVERHTSKARRMYGQGLDQAMNQQNPAANRFEALSRQRTNSVKTLNQSKSAVGLAERYGSSTTVYTSSPTFRTTSPSPPVTSPVMGRFDAIDGRTSAAGNHSNLAYAPPLSPTTSAGEESTAFESALEPDDKGKATSLGLFNRPTKYDEQQYSRRQLQLHEGRNTPELPKRSPTAPTIPTGFRKPSQASLRSNHSNDFAFRRRESEAEAAPRQQSKTEQEVSAGTFFANSSDSETSDSEEDVSVQRQASSSTHASAMSSPMMSPTVPNFNFFGDAENTSMNERIPSKPDMVIAEEEIPEDPKTDELPATAESDPDSVAIGGLDSPTLGPTEGLGLSGLVRTHLRQDSDTSRYSVLPPPSPQSFAGVPRAEARNNNVPISIHSNPWEFDDVDTVQEDYDNNATLAPPVQSPTVPPSPAIAMAERARQMLDLAKNLREATNVEMGSPERVHERSMTPAESQHTRSSEENTPPKSWQDEMKARHARNGSTESQKEVDDFARELAERRRKVQENLKSVVGSDSRAASPHGGPRMQDKSANPFGMLKVKTSIASMNGRQDNKAGKMFGLGPSPNQTPARSPSAETWGPEHDNMHNMHNKLPYSAKPRPLHVPTFQQPWQKNRKAPSPRLPNEEHMDSSMPPRTARPSARDRSNSELSTGGRSKSRPGRMPHESRAMSPEMHGHVRQPMGPIVESRHAPHVQPPARRSDESLGRGHPAHEATPVGPPARMRTNSRAASNPYFEGAAMLHVQPGLPSPLTSPRPSPFAAYSANSTPPLDRSPETFAAPAPASAASYVVPPPGYGTRHPSAAPRKKSVVKSLISEPTFVSSTSNVTTVGLPPGASLKNGMESPPVPPMNPRRRLTLFNRSNTDRSDRSEKSSYLESPPPVPFASLSTTSIAYSDDRSTFSDDGEKRARSQQQRLRKTSSEGGSLNAKARAQVMAGPSPAMPNFPPMAHAEGAMF